MIKVVVFGLVCIAGVGAIAATASKSTPVPVPSVVYPTVAGTKADRLSLVSIHDIQPRVEQVAPAYTPPSEPQLPARPQPKELAKAKIPEFTPRHWHDPNDVRAGMKKTKAEPSKSIAQKGSTTKLADAQNCRTDGIGSLMRTLNLQPACDH